MFRGCQQMANIFIKFGNWLDRKSVKERISALEMEQKEQHDYMAKLATQFDIVIKELREELQDQEQIDLQNNRLAKLEALVELLPSKKSVEENLNILDKKVSAIMVSNNFPQFRPVDHDSDDPMKLFDK